MPVNNFVLAFSVLLRSPKAIDLPTCLCASCNTQRNRVVYISVGFLPLSHRILKTAWAERYSLIRIAALDFEVRGWMFNVVYWNTIGINLGLISEFVGG